MSILPYVVAGSAKRNIFYGPCRRVARRRLAQPCRTFRTGTLLRASAANDPNEAADTNPSTDSATIQKLVDEAVRKATAGYTADDPNGEERDVEDVQPSTDRLKPIDRKHYGSWRKRASRGAQEIQMTVPEWFVNENVKLWSDSLSEPVSTESPRERATIQPDLENQTVQPQIESTDTPTAAQTSTQSHSTEHADEDRSTVLLGDRYGIQKNIFEEIKHMVSGGLRAATAQPTENALLSRPHLLLQSPQSGAEYFLDHVVKATTQQLGADLIQVDAQDVAAIASDLPDVLPEQTVAAIKRLGFDTYVYDEDGEPEPLEESSNDLESNEDDVESPNETPSRPGSAKLPNFNLSNLKPLQQVVQLWLPSRERQGRTSNLSKPGPSPITDFFTSANGVTTPYASTPQDLIQTFLRGFLDSAHLKRRRELLRSQDSNETPSGTTSEFPRSLVVHIHGYLELSATSIGARVIDRIHTAVDAKRKDGQQVLIVGTSAAADLFPATLSEEGFRSLQAGNDSDRLRTLVTPCANEEAETMFTSDASKRTSKINLRNVQAVISELYSSSLDIQNGQSMLDMGSNDAAPWDFELTNLVWPLEKVQRLVTLAHGITEPGKRIDMTTISRARSIMLASDREKTKWADNEKAVREPELSPTAPNVQEEKRKAQLKQCNRYEKKLLTGVVDAEKIKTSFADVHVPPKSIEAVKTLTTLSLIRPDAFSYGVLATDKIPGLLLYGPPGTGKTMLAKAVAKESGATVLEVSGSEVYDMYVGEGEKNVRAIFTLARKLSPCVVFIDEADAIFGSRSGGINRRSHRELINQFLKEWDGMNELSTFIMVATNRPFDLDDAVLRRLPRRLLVDLPSEKDRKAILEIHLKEELVEEDVSLSELAARTPYYSGSDLKNVAVAAALACVKEENEAAAKEGGSPYEFPSRRRLTKAHFESALSEISASISEDMSSLKAIRQFDERYGDRRGRKKSGGLGFGTHNKQDAERDKQQGGRVRKLEVEV